MDPSEEIGLRVSRRRITNLCREATQCVVTCVDSIDTGDRGDGLDVISRVQAGFQCAMSPSLLQVCPPACGAVMLLPPASFLDLELRACSCLPA